MIKCTTSRRILREYTSPPISILRSFSHQVYAHNFIIKLEYITPSFQDFFIHLYPTPANGSGHTCSFERDLTNLAIVLDDINRFSLTIDEGCDLLGALGTTH